MADSKKKKSTKTNKKIKRKYKKRRKLPLKVTLWLLGIIIAILISLCTFSYVKYKDPWYFFRPLLEEENKDSSSSPNISGDAVVPGVNGVSKTYYAVISKEEYYKDVQNILNNKTGKEIKTALNTLISNDIRQPSYGEARYMLSYTDESLNNRGTLVGIYDDKVLPSAWDGKSWTREHVWPCDKMRIPPNNTDDNYRPGNSTRDHRSDLHNLRAINQSTNASRSNKYYSTETTKETYFPNQGELDHRGDVARILFYMETRYPKLNIVETPKEHYMEMGQLSLLLKWNEEDPVDDFEIQRNNRIYEYQGNRNPYIDYPELVNKIFAN